MASILRIKKEEIVGTLPPPPGVIPNFEHPESQRHRLIITIATMLPLATLVLSLRLYTRGMIVRYMGSDDYAIILGWLLSIAYSITFVFLFNVGLGIHIWDVPLTTFSPHFLKLAIINGVFYGMSFMCVKLSILLLYLRLSPYPRFRIMVWVIIATTVTYSVLGSFNFLFNCRPIAKNWDITITDGSCINSSKILMTHSTLNIVTDIAMLILPIMLVQKLKMPLRRKVALAGLFMTGTFVCIVSSIRLKSLLDLVRSADYTWIAIDASIWSIIEISVGIICSCLANFKPFLRRHFPRVLGSSYQPEAFTPQFSRRIVNTAPNTLTSEYELESCERRRKSGMARMSKQQTGIDNESQEDILGDGYPKNISVKSEVIITSDAGPLPQKDSFR